MHWDHIVYGSLGELWSLGKMFFYIIAAKFLGRKGGWKNGALLVLGFSAFYLLGIVEAANAYEEEQRVKWAIVLALSGIASVIYGNWIEQRLPEDLKEVRDRWERSTWR